MRKRSFILALRPPPCARWPGALGSCTNRLATALGFWTGRALATGTAWAGLCSIYHHRSFVVAPKEETHLYKKRKQNKRETKENSAVGGGSTGGLLNEDTEKPIRAHIGSRVTKELNRMRGRTNNQNYHTGAANTQNAAINWQAPHAAPALRSQFPISCLYLRPTAG